ncbi:MAG TPA: RagB/SusD family nutrient uptake outer membrane protein [Chitinophaga sp.]|uniref:RagB/SusD family nutrient uptake outer membrane protein n=1 Tax=Chitinophaga sp. TaxID=1869181 RepID=UPI002DB9FCAC|nr:RagB/SusD family nutrient uptake outer membrane protein [Chitinophaga sp.]HEU4555469.1 RagB/SusD family nutrient uptake outer membrane protein [Chitinophaga sp.]
MKNTKYLLLLTCLLSACGKGFLDISPEQFQKEGNYFKNADQFNQAMNGAYAPLQGLYTGSHWVMTEMRSDNTSYQKNTSDASGFSREELDEFREQDDNSYVYSFFNYSYNGISRCNTVLDHLSGASIDETVKAQITGQASFLRALYYFNLVRLYGDIPLTVHEVTSTNGAFSIADRKPAADVYTQIIADAQAAIDNLPDAWTNAKDKGRAVKASAQTLLAEVYLTQKQYDKAIPLLRAVMQSPNGYTLLPDYASLYTLANENSAESIFEVQYMEGSSNEYSDFMYQFAPYNAGSGITGFGLYTGSGSGWNIPTQNMLDAYEAGDKRKDASISLSFTDPNTNKVVPYVIKYKTPHAIRYQTGSNFPVYRFADVLLMLAECLNETAFAANGEAYTLLNQVRARAGLAPKTAGNANPALNVSSQEAFRQAVWQERRVELAFEDHRWFDLLRTGQATAVMQAHAVEEKSLKSYLVPAAYTNIRPQYQYPRREVQLMQ